jgi:F-type H+-transporting ATPase subunit b
LATGARQVATELAMKQTNDLRRQAKDVGQSVARQTVQEVFAIARKALVDLADASLDERMSAVFSRRLKAMDGESKAKLRQSLTTSGEPALVRSAFEVNPEQRASIQNAVNETFSADVHLRFEIAPELVNGIDLTSGGQRTGWNISSYLSSLEQEVNALLTPSKTAKPLGPT